MNGQIVTEGFDEFYYKNNSDCTWELVATEELKPGCPLNNFHIEIKVINFMDTLI